MPTTDRDRSGPPGVKLPEQQPSQPLQPKKSKFSRQSLAIMAAAGLLIVVMITVFIVFVVNAGRSPMQAVRAALKEDFSFHQELVQVSLSPKVTDPDPGSEDGPTVTVFPGERSVYFFVSNEQLACALLSRRATGYEVQDVAGHLPLTGDGKDGIWMATGGTGTEYLVFGLLYNPDKTKVEVEGKPAVVVDTGRYRLWYYINTGSMAINSESVVYK
ncbi:hypothetical protein LJC60_02615 [Ruminococcaceae bacterium OttesenSCG-928-D13]|nr:hypothetical protein [Ruminococcaceae bacterium OttesenSCG-928-D13]